MTTAENYSPKRSALPPGKNAVDAPREGRSSSTAGVKRPADHADVAMPPSKRSCPASSTEDSNNELPNREHRRVILCDYGMAIYKASSRSALLAAIEDCIGGHESSYKEGFLHRDISINIF